MAQRNFALVGYLFLALCLSADVAEACTFKFAFSVEGSAVGDQQSYKLFLIEDCAAGESSAYGRSGLDDRRVGTVSGSLVAKVNQFVSYQPDQNYTQGVNVSVTNGEVVFSQTDPLGSQASVDHLVNGRTTAAVGTVVMTTDNVLPVPSFPEFVIYFDVLGAGDSTKPNSVTLVPGTTGSGSPENIPIAQSESTFTESPDDVPTPTPTPKPTPAPIGKFSFSASSITSSRGAFTANFRCSGKPQAACSAGKAEFYDPNSVKKPKKPVNALPSARTVYASCSIRSVIAPTPSSCVMKLSSAAKTTIQRKKKLKGSFALESSGFTKPAISTLTVK